MKSPGHHRCSSGLVWGIFKNESLNNGMAHCPLDSVRYVGTCRTSVVIALEELSYKISQADQSQGVNAKQGLR